MVFVYKKRDALDAAIAFIIEEACYDVVAGIMGHSCFVSRIGVVHHRSQLYAARCSFGEQLSVAAVKYGHPRRFAPVLGQRQ